MNAAHYTMVIDWSDEDQAFLVTFPEWAAYIAQPVTHGDTYEEAARKGRDVLDNLIATAQNEGQPVPAPAAARTPLAHRSGRGVRGEGPAAPASRARSRSRPH